jgi:DNA-binding transcriptional LysR family regulator
VEILKYFSERGQNIMNIQHLKYAVEVAKTGSITQAAENLYMGQPNLSKAIKELESSLAITIFKRTGKGVVPTKKGQEFLGYARNILDQIEELESLYKPDQCNKQRFSIAVPRGSYITHAFAEFIGTLDPEREIAINFKETNSLQVIESIDETETKLGIIRYQTVFEKYFLDLLQERELRYEVFWEFEYVVLMSAQHPLAERPEVDYNELGNYIEIIQGDLAIPSLPFAEIRKMQREEHLKKHIYVYERGSQFELLSKVTKTYMWVSPIPAELLQRYGLVQRPCEAARRQVKDLLIYPKGYRLSKVEKAFLEKLQAVRDRLA